MANRLEVPSSVINDKNKAEEMAYAGKPMRDRANKKPIVSERGSEFLKRLADRQENKAGADYERKKEYEEMGLDAERIELHQFVPKEIDKERLEEDHKLEEKRDEYLLESIITVLKNKKIVKACKTFKDDRERFSEFLAQHQVPEGLTSYYFSPKALKVANDQERFEELLAQYIMDDLLSKHFSPEALEKANDHEKKYDPYGKTPRIVFEKRMLERQVYSKDEIMSKLTSFIETYTCEINQGALDHAEEMAKARKKQHKERSQIGKE